MMTQIERFFDTAVITAGSSAVSTSARFPFGRYSGGGVLIASTGGATTISWHVAAGAQDVPVPLYVDGSAVTSSVTVGAQPIPDACFGFQYVAPIIVGAASLPLTVSVKG